MFDGGRLIKFFQDFCVDDDQSFKLGGIVYQSLDEPPLDNDPATPKLEGELPSWEETDRQINKDSMFLRMFPNLKILTWYLVEIHNPFDDKESLQKLEIMRRRAPAHDQGIDPCLVFGNGKWIKYEYFTGFMWLIDALLKDRRTRRKVVRKE